jgi:hypothetical protein
MIALKLVHLIETHSDSLAKEMVARLETSPRTTDLRKVPQAELHARIHEIVRHFSDWLLAKTGDDIENRYFEIGQRRASQGVSLSDFSWGMVIVKQHLREFLQREVFMRGPVEIYGELELVQLLDQFFDRALCFAAEGFEEYRRQHAAPGSTEESRIAAASL